MHRSRRLIAPLILALFATASCREDARLQLRIFAAASLTDLMSALEVAYEEDHPGIDLRFHFAGSNELCAQLIAGASADLFIPASMDENERADEAGVLISSSSVALFANRLSWVRADGASAGDLERFALADPDAVPAGRYAREWLTALGEWERIEPKMAPSPNVRAALALVISGAAQEGIVYTSDLLAAPRLSVIREQEPSELPEILYPGTIVRGANPLVSDFLRWISEYADAHELVRKHGFTPASERN